MALDHIFCRCEALREKGNQLLVKGDYKKAIKILDEVLVIHPDDAQAWGTKGICYDELNMPEAAMEAYDKALSFDPNYIFALSNKASHLAREKHYKEALALIDKVLTLDPKFHDALLHKGLILCEQNQYEQSIPCLDRALAINPRNPVTLRKRGAAALEVIMRTHPDQTMLHCGQDFPVRELSEAGGYLQKATEADPKQLETWYYFGVFMHLMNHPTAVDLFKGVLKADPNHSGARKFLEKANKTLD